MRATQRRRQRMRPDWANRTLRSAPPTYIFFACPDDDRDVHATRARKAIAALRPATLPPPMSGPANITGYEFVRAPAEARRRGLKRPQPR